MRKNKKYTTLENNLSLLLRRSQEKALSIKDIVEILSGKGRLLILIFLSLPFCQPIQIPGLSTPFGLVIAFIGLRMAFGKRIWLPQVVLSKRVSSAKMKKLLEKSLRLVKKIKRWIHPRVTWICEYYLSQVINGLLIGILGIFLALPVPVPFTNLAAAWSIVLISIGILEDDGLFVLLGYILSLITILLFVGIGMSIKHII